MKKKVLIVLLAFSVGTVICQEKKFDIELNFDPSISYWNIIRPEPFNENVMKPAPRFGYGISVFYNLKNRLSIGTGIINSKKGYNTGNNDCVDTLGNPLGSLNIKLIYEYIEVPIKIRYKILLQENILNPYLSFSFSNQFIIKQSEINNYSTDWSSTKFENKEINGLNNLEDEGFRPYNLGLCLGAGIKYSLTDRLLFGVEPKINYSLFTVWEKKDAVKFNLYNVGVDIQVGYKF